jgi:AcrR family transcriptional regulator
MRDRHAASVRAPAAASPEVPARHDPAGASTSPPPGPLWTRPAEVRKPRLTLEAIVDAAVELADAEGLEAVSIRRVAAVLNVRPMSLYSHIHRKDDLLDLMLDRIAAEVLLPDLPRGDWQEALRAIAHQSRQTALRHPWILRTIGSRPRIGPNAIRHIEQSLAALADLPVDRARKVSILTAVDTYAIGNIVSEVADRVAWRQEGETDPGEWQQSVRGYLRRMVDTGDFPHLAEIGVDDLPLSLGMGDGADQRFEEGLTWLLAGIAVSLPNDG